MTLRHFLDYFAIDYETVEIIGDNGEIIEKPGDDILDRKIENLVTRVTLKKEKTE